MNLCSKINVFITPGWWQLKTLNPIEEGRSKFFRNIVLDCHLSPVATGNKWQSKTKFLTIFFICVHQLLIGFSIAAYRMCSCRNTNLVEQQLRKVIWQFRDISVFMSFNLMQLYLCTQWPCSTPLLHFMNCTRNLLKYFTLLHIMSQHDKTTKKHLQDWCALRRPR